MSQIRGRPRAGRRRVWSGSSTWRPRYRRTVVVRLGHGGLGDTDGAEPGTPSTAATTRGCGGGGIIGSARHRGQTHLIATKRWCDSRATQKPRTGRLRRSAEIDCRTDSRLAWPPVAVIASRVLPLNLCKQYATRPARTQRQRPRGDHRRGWQRHRAVGLTTLRPPPRAGAFAFARLPRLHTVRGFGAGVHSARILGKPAGPPPVTPGQFGAIKLRLSTSRSSQ